MGEGDVFSIIYLIFTNIYKGFKECFIPLRKGRLPLNDVTVPKSVSANGCKSIWKDGRKPDGLPVGGGGAFAGEGCSVSFPFINILL